MNWHEFVSTIQYSTVMLSDINLATRTAKKDYNFAMSISRFAVEKKGAISGKMVVT